jgi:rod shape-determining protein MreD
MRWFRFAGIVIVVMLLQAGLVDVVAIASIKFDLLLILLVFFAVYCSASDAIITSFAIGFAADTIGSAIGPQTISFGLFGTLLAYLNSIIAVRRMPYQSLVIAVVSLLSGTSALLLTFLKGQPTPPNAFLILLGTSLYSAAVGPYLFLPLLWLTNVRTHHFYRR